MKTNASIIGKWIVGCCFLLLGSLGGQAQTKAISQYIQRPDTVDSKDDSNALFVNTDEMPQFPGGDRELVKYINKQLDSLWPISERTDSVSRRVIVRFAIDSTGIVRDPVVMRGINPQLDSIAISIVRKMPRWMPGKRRGKPTRVKYTVPITFRGEISNKN